MADHARLSQLLAKTVDIPLVFQAFRSFDHDERVRSNVYHRFIRDTIARGDSQEAGKLMTEHIFMGREVLPILHDHSAVALEEAIAPTEEDAGPTVEVTEGISAG